MATLTYCAKSDMRNIVLILVASIVAIGYGAPLPKPGSSGSLLSDGQRTQVRTAAKSLSSQAGRCGSSADATMLSTAELNRIADAIYRIEGGAKTRYPYGVKSVKTSDPRRVTINSIHNNYARWQKVGKPGYFGDFMASRWCPESADPVGNKNWKANFRKLVGKVNE